MTIPSTICTSDIMAIIDTREQHPLNLSPLRTVTGTLVTGDYSVQGLENVITIERKSIDDLLQCCGRKRERFEREIMRLLAYPTRAIVVEATCRDIAAGQWRSRLTPKQVEASLIGWLARGLPVLLSGDHRTAGRHVACILFIAARRRYHEARALLADGKN